MCFLFHETTLENEKIYEGKILTLNVDKVSLDNGTKARREWVHHSGGVCILPVDKDKNILLVQQYRHPYQKCLLEIPAGKKEYGENPLTCAKRELREETGYTAAKYGFLGEFYPTPAYVDEVIHMYCAWQLTYVGQKLDPDEFLSVKKIPLEKAVQMVLNGEIVDGKTQTAILKAYLQKDINCVYI